MEGIGVPGEPQGPDLIISQGLGSVGEGGESLEGIFVQVLLCPAELWFTKHFSRCTPYLIYTMRVVALHTPFPLQHLNDDCIEGISYSLESLEWFLHLVPPRNPRAAHPVDVTRSLLNSSGQQVSAEEDFVLFPVL